MATDVPADDRAEHASSCGATMSRSISEADRRNSGEESGVEYGVVIREPYSGSDIHSQQRTLRPHASGKDKSDSTDEMKDDEKTALLQKKPGLHQAPGSVACVFGQSDSASSGMCLAGQVLQKLGCALQPRLMGRLGEVPATWRVEVLDKSEET